MVVAAAVESTTGDTTEVTDARESDGHETVKEVIHAFATEGDHAADRHVFADLEVRDSLAGAGDHRLLAGDLGHVANGGVDKLLVVNGFTDTHVQRDLSDTRNLHRGLVAELLHEFGDNGVVIHGTKTRHCHPH